MANDEQVKAITEEQAARIGEEFKAAGTSLTAAFKRFVEDVTEGLTNLYVGIDAATETVKAAKTAAAAGKAEDAAAAGEPEPGPTA